MNSDRKAATLIPLVVSTIFFSIWFFLSLKIGYNLYFQFRKNHETTQCLVMNTNVIERTYSHFQATWIVKYNDTQSEKISKIFSTNYTTYTDAIEETINQYKIGQVYPCYYNKNKAYDLSWTIDSTVNKGKSYLIVALMFGLLILFIWIVPAGYFSFKCLKKNNESL
ncbi:hypothetical protein I4U23_016714 [Adineta vaga]|nr:hypothetical protein I4U23_016714 [Adineta vaga]